MGFIKLYFVFTMDIMNNFKWNALFISYVTRGLIFVDCLSRGYEFVDTPWISLRYLPACPWSLLLVGYR